MKRFLTIGFIFCFFNSFSQTGYDTINHKYFWYAGRFKALQIPAGSGFPTFIPQQWTGAGGFYEDSVSGKVYAYRLGAWKALADSGTGGGSPTVGTFSQRNALSPTNGTEFFQTDDGRDAPAGRYFYLDTIWNYTPLRDEDFFYYFNDFSGHAGVSNGTTTLMGMLKAGAAGAGSFVSFSGGNDMFYGFFGTGTATTGFAKLAADDGASTANTGFKASKENLYFKTTIQSVSQKSNLTDVFNIDAGFVSAVAGAIGTEYGFRYDSATSANWLYKNGNNAYASTGVAFAAATPYKLEVLARSDSVFYWINNTQVAAEATLNNTVFLTPLLRIIKSAGSTAVTMTVDYVKLWARLTATQTR